MKTISKKIKTIYLLAMMAIISVCIAVFPVFKTETVKAEDDFGLSMAGATVQFSERNGANDFALMFQAKISKQWYMDSVDGLSDDVKFGMAIVPASEYANVASYEQLVAYAEKVSQDIIFTDLIGTLDCNQLLEFPEDATEITYEAGTYFCKGDEIYEGITDAQWQAVYAKELTAIPFYSMDGEVLDYETTYAQAYTTSATKTTEDQLFLVDTALPTDAEEALDLEDVEKVTGKKFQEVYNSAYDEIYFDQSLNIFLSNQQAGGGTNKYLDHVRWWFPYESGKTSSSFLCATKYSTYLAGQKMLNGTAPSTWTTRSKLQISSTWYSDTAIFAEMVPGKEYRCYYSLNANPNTIYYFDYEVATQVFTAIYASTSATQGTSLLRTKVMTEGASGSTYQHYFKTNLNVSTLYMPYAHSNSSYKYEQESYGGHYVLGANIVMTAPNTGTTNKVASYNDGKSDNKTYTSNGAPSTKTNVEAISLGALKHVASYITSFQAANVVGLSGTFDGKGRTIDASFSRGGLLGIIKGGTVKNLNINADLYDYTMSDSTVKYTNNSYSEKSSVLAEYIMDATIENVSITLKENAPATFTKKQQDGSANNIDTLPEMDNVPGLLASQAIKNSSLKNVIIKCDSLKDAGLSIQNYRAALNADTNCDMENVFVIGSSYSYMNIDKIDGEYLLTLSVQDGIDVGTYTLEDNPELAPYFEMATDMFKYMKNIDVTGQIVKVRFIRELATESFADDAAFQAYLASEAGAEAKAALLATRNWVETDGVVAWKNLCPDTHYTAIKGSYSLADKPVADASADPFTWVNFVTYNPSVTLANGAKLA